MLADIFVWLETFERLESSGEVVGFEEVVGVFERAVHAFDVAVGPGMVGLGKPVFDSVNKTEPVEAGTIHLMKLPSPRRHTFSSTLPQMQIFFWRLKDNAFISTFFPIAFAFISLKKQSFSINEHSFLTT